MGVVLSRNSQGLRTVVSDWLLVAILVAALIVPSAMILLVPIIFLRGARPPPISGELACLGLSAGWACMVIVQRGTGTSAGQLPYYAFLWLMPFLLAAFQPTEHTIRRFGHMLLTLFVLDLAFNLYALATGADLLGRSLDVREGVVAGRGGGIFAHSFYSGSISIAGLLTLVSRTRSRWLMLLPLANLLLAGSWRFAAAILILWVFSLGWRNRSRLREALMVAVASILSLRPPGSLIWR
jgi:hypothetical protein